MKRELLMNAMQEYNTRASVRLVPAEKVPEKVIAGALDHFAKGCPPEQVIGLHDLTFWGTGTRGLLLAEHAVYCSSLLPAEGWADFRIDFEDIHLVRVVGLDRSMQLILIHGDGREEVRMAGEFTVNLSILLKELTAMASRNSVSVKTRPGSAADARPLTDHLDHLISREVSAGLRAPIEEPLYQTSVTELWARREALLENGLSAAQEQNAGAGAWIAEQLDRQTALPVSREQQAHAAAVARRFDEQRQPVLSRKLLQASQFCRSHFTDQQVEHIRQMASHGRPQYQMTLSCFPMVRLSQKDGECSPEDFEQAAVITLKLLESAAAQGCPEALLSLSQISLGYFCSRPPDVRRSFQLLRQAAQSGYSYAFTALAKLYLNGRGVAADPNFALLLLSRAAQLGDVEAAELFHKFQ